MIFRDRAEAGRSLAWRFGKYANRHDVAVLALPRGGVPVAFEIAKALRAPLEVFLLRKLGVPGNRNSPSARLRRPEAFVSWTPKSCGLW